MKYVNLKAFLDWLLKHYGDGRGVGAYILFAIIEHLQEMKNEMGQWEEYSNNDEYTYICSGCRCIESKPTPFCPHCGLPMKGADV